MTGHTLRENKLHMHIPCLLATFLLASLLSSFQVDAQQFDPRVDLTVGNSPLATGLADLDGDGRPDLLATVLDEAELAVFPNTSPEPGVLSFGARLDFSIGSNPQGLLVADLDADGRLDVVTANSGAGGNISILRNASSEGNISLTDRIDIPVNTAHRVAAGDFDGDTKLDLAVTDNANSRIYIFRNTSSLGVISFSHVQFLGTSSFSNWVAIADMDFDGRPDVLAPVPNLNSLFIYLNQSSDGSIGFASPSAFAAGNGADGIRIGDLDNDGKADIVTANPSAGSVSLFLNQSTPGTLSLAARQDFSAGPLSHDLAIGDFDRDGRLDVAVTTNDSGDDDEVVILRNTESPFGLLPEVTLATGSNPYTPAVADVDGDGFSDVAVSNNGGMTVSVFRNAGGPGSYFTILPCRIVDTRNPDGPYGGPIFTSGQSRVFTVPGTCSIPAFAKAVVVNVTAIGASGPGYLTLYPADQALPNTSTVNFPPGTARANNAIAALSEEGALAVWPFVGSDGQVHVIIDVAGYFD